jgi:cytochrome c-type biogenesis protein CcmH/NrfF
VKFTSRAARSAVALVAVCATLLPTAASALGAGACPRTSELAMETKVMCQVCGVPLAVASSLEADRERAFIRTLVNRCESPRQIEAAMIAQYGPGILATPGTHGFAILAWLVPAAAILGSAIGIALVLRPIRRRRSVLSPVSAPAPSDAEERLLDAALGDYRARG